MEISNKPLDKAGIIKRLTAEGFHFSKKPAVIKDEEQIKKSLEEIKKGILPDVALLQHLEKEAEHDLLNALCYVVNMADDLRIPIPKMKEALGLLLLEKCAYTAIELVNPDMCDLAQVYFREINNQPLWIKAHARVQQGFPEVFAMSEELRKKHDEFEAFMKKYKLDDKSAKQWGKLIAEYLQQVLNLMDMFSMLDPMYITKQVDTYFKKHCKGSEKFFSKELQEALKAFEDSNASFEDLRLKVEAIPC